MDRTASMPRDPQDPKSLPLAARTVNVHRAAILALCNWCVTERRLTTNPLAGLPKAEEVEPARKRRALTEEEIVRLLAAAKERLLTEALTVRRGKNRGKPLANVRQEVKDHLRRLGRERALLYRFMIMTGLRKGEVATLPVSGLDLDAEHPCVHIEGRHAKSGRSAVLPLRRDLAEALRRHLGDLGDDAGEFVFDVPSNFTRVFDADLAAAACPEPVEGASPRPTARGGRWTSTACATRSRPSWPAAACRPEAHAPQRYPPDDEHLHPP